MKTATVNVRFVNQPGEGKKKGTIKTVDDQLFGVWPDKLAEFQAGGTYEIEYEENDFKGKTYRTVKTVKSASITSGGNGSAKPLQRETSGKDAERIFICGILNNAVRAGKLAPDDTEAIVHVIRAGRAAWEQTFGAGEEAPY